MKTQPIEQRNLDGYGTPEIPWEKVRDVLSAGVAQITQPPGSGGPDRHTCWLATTGPGGRSQVRPVGVAWVDGIAHFTAGPATQKAKNLAADPRCSITVATKPFDIAIEGQAERITDHAELQRVAAEFAEAGWTPTVRAGTFYAEFSAPSAGPPPWWVYRMVPTTVYAFGTAEPFGATRWRL